MAIATMLLKAPHVGIRNLKTNLSKFIKRKRPIIVTERGIPVEVLIPYSRLVRIVEFIDKVVGRKDLRVMRKGRSVKKDKSQR